MISIFGSSIILKRTYLPDWMRQSQNQLVRLLSGWTRIPYHLKIISRGQWQIYRHRREIISVGGGSFYPVLIVGSPGRLRLLPAIHWQLVGWATESAVVLRRLTPYHLVHSEGNYSTRLVSLMRTCWVMKTMTSTPEFAKMEEQSGLILRWRQNILPGQP